MAKKEGIKKHTVIIVLLSAACMLLVALAIFLLFGNNSVSGSGKFLQSTYSLQNKLSLYIGKTASDTFGAYTNEELVTGKLSSGEEIKGSDDDALKALVDTDEKIEENGKIAYKINEENLKSLLNTSMPSFDGIEFYIQDGQLVKVKITSKPEWWNEDLDFLLVGQD